MNYKFPVINNISDVLPIIKDRKEFVVVDKGYQTFVNYVVAGDTTFPEVTDYDTAIVRELRGIAFDSFTGEIVSRPFHKFFNINEREETLLENIDFSKPHYIVEKLDGSMVRPVKGPGGDIVFHTKMGFTDIGAQATKFALQNKQYLELAKWAIEYGFTPIFEWCSRKNRIVIDHPEDRLVLLHMRRNTSGNYTPRWHLEQIAERFNVDRVKAAAFRKGTNLDYFRHMLAGILQKQDEEGYVITFEDGHMCKVKNTWYLNLHRTKDDISSERKVVKLILTNTLDDLKSMLDKEDLERINSYEKEFTETIAKLARNVEEYVHELRDVNQYTKKYYAQVFAVKTPKLMNALVFKVWENKNAYESIVQMITNALNNNRKFDEIKNEFFPEIKYREMWQSSDD
ncbi:RNA ligase [Caulobacter phage Cr30]|uniref:RNA ligase and tail fiber protein attachment catalyst n=1 Tax=Caulobacter phage Cr30 TaxID=1357714 RepID=UPI0004A9B95B|nr:RNA ligase and tail fiber protein attachment catalyst [Caulobacter phage Cr30]AGS80907.1 RNA ligase [Caulobacter phage Cr30]